VIKTDQQTDMSRRFGGVQRLYGKTALQNFQQAHVLVIGVGGVGSWVAEALARNAIAKITLVDMDVVAESNINRQLPALSSTLGRNKIDVMAERIKDINPECEIITIDDFVTKENIEDIISSDTSNNIDFVVDCIDNSRVKAAMISWCKRQKIKIITLGGAGGQTNPNLIQVSDLSKTVHDPLLSKTRKLLRQDYGFTKNIKRRFSIPCVFSPEHLKYPLSSGEMSNDKPTGEAALTDLNCAGGIG